MAPVQTNPWKDTFAEWMNAALGLVYPEVCQLCQKHRATPGQGYVCDICRGDVQFIESPFCERCGLPFEGEITQSFQCANCDGIDWHLSSARSAALAKGVVLEAIHGYKYRNALWYEAFLAELLLGRAAPILAGGGWDCIVPVPLHSVKQRERQFNQAERLAVHLGAALNLPVRTDVLKRVQPTNTQTRLSRAERQRNVRSAFELGRRAQVNGLRVILVDDVFTTGATTNACARRLVKGGAADVCVWTVARGT